jgi:hypothetical protein
VGVKGANKGFAGVQLGAINNAKKGSSLFGRSDFFVPQKKEKQMRYSKKAEAVSRIGSST